MKRHVDIKKEFTIFRKVVELGIANTLLSAAALITLVDGAGLKAWQYTLISVPALFIFRYGYGRYRGLYR